MIYKVDFEIFYKDTTSNDDKIRLDVLLLLLQESAILHSEKVGFTQDYMKANQCGWVLNKLSLIMNYIPKMRERITIETWSREIKSFKAIREFRIFKGNECIGTASTLWFFIDTSQKKLKRIPEEVKNFYGEYNQKVGIDLEPLDIQEYPLENILTKKHILRICDIDTNGHLNNTVYAQFVTDLLQNLVPTFLYKQFSILYKREIPYTTTPIHCGISKIDGKKYFFKIYNDEIIYSIGEIEIY